MYAMRTYFYNVAFLNKLLWDIFRSEKKICFISTSLTAAFKQTYSEGFGER